MLLVGILKLVDYQETSRIISEGKQSIRESSDLAKYYQGMTAQELERAGVSQGTIDSIKKSQQKTALYSTIAISGAAFIGAMIFISK
jgi:hypothetical protein